MRQTLSSSDLTRLLALVFRVDVLFRKYMQVCITNNLLNKSQRVNISNFNDKPIADVQR